jgi:hypothetical protein
MSASRSDWLAINICRVAPVFDVLSLQFLATGTSVLSTSAARAIVTDIDRLLAAAAGSPEVFASALGGMKAVDVLDALNAAVSAVELIAGPEGEEEGDGPQYLFAYLKSLRALFSEAIETGSDIVHTRHEH